MSVRRGDKTLHVSCESVKGDGRRKYIICGMTQASAQLRANEIRHERFQAERRLSVFSCNWRYIGIGWWKMFYRR